MNDVAYGLRRRTATAWRRWEPITGVFAAPKGASASGRYDTIASVAFDPRRRRIGCCIVGDIIASYTTVAIVNIVEVVIVVCVFCRAGRHVGIVLREALSDLIGSVGGAEALLLSEAKVYVRKEDRAANRRWPH